MSTKRKWLAALPAALILASITTFAVAQVAGSGGVGRLLVYLNGSQKYVDRVNFNGFTGVQDGGLLTLSGGGGSASNPTGCVQGAVTIANSDAGDPTCNSNYVTIDNAGNVTLPNGATIDGRDISVDMAKLDTIISPVEKSSLQPAAATDGGSNGQTWNVPVRIVGTGGATVNGDAGYKMPNDLCSVNAPSGMVTTFTIRWTGVHVAGFDAGNQPTGLSILKRLYSVRNASGTLTIAAFIAEGDQLSAGLGTSAAGAVNDGSVVEPWVQGNAATNIRWDCTISDIESHTLP